MITPATVTMLADDPVARWLFGSGGRAAQQSGSAIAPAVDSLFMVIFWISMFSFALLMGLVLYFVFRYRARPGVPGQRSVSHNTPLELVWSIAPLIVMTWMFFKGFWIFMDMQIAEAGAEPIAVVARQWTWTFTYPNGAISPEKMRVAGTDNPVFVIPADMPVKLTMSAENVIHSFWVPAFRGKRDIFPNRYTTYQFRANPLTEDDPWHEPVVGDETRTGPFHELGYRYRDHYVFCAEFCGDQHSEMAAIIRVVNPDVYAKVLERWATPDLTDPIITLNFIRNKYGCVSCHTIDGTASTGPTWKNLFGYEVLYADGQTRLVDADRIRIAVYDPAAEIRAGFPNQMNSYQGTMSQEHFEKFLWAIQQKEITDKGPKSILDDAGKNQPNEQPAGGGGDGAGDGGGDGGGD